MNKLEKIPRRRIMVEMFGTEGVTLRVEGRVLENFTHEEARVAAGLLLAMSREEKPS